MNNSDGGVGLNMLSRMLKFQLLYPKLVRERMNLRDYGSALKHRRYNFHWVRSGHVRFVSELTEVSECRITQYLTDLHDEDWFFAELDQKYQRFMGQSLSPHFFKHSESSGSVFFPAVTMYLLVRAAQPQIVVETGGGAGKSTAFILLALRHNGGGRLITLDLPPDHAVEAEQSMTWWTENMRSCFLVPDMLREYHELRLGDAKRTLPESIREVTEIDMFRHDSDHSYEHMMFEFETIWPVLRVGGILMSDDVHANNAWADFCSRHQLSPVKSTRYFAGATKSGVIKA